MLYADIAGGGPRVVLVHGFTQTGRSWAPIVGRLRHTHEVVTVDVPGHGGSAAIRADLWRSGRLLGDLGPADYIGYSMGGRMLLHLALQRPDLVRRLVLIGVTGGIDDPEARAARREADEELARSIETDGVDAFLARWLDGPLFATLSPAAANIGDRRRNTADGLAWSLRLCGTGQQDPPLWDRLGTIGASGLPVLVVVGEHDDKFEALGRRLVSSIGATAKLAIVPGAGHAAHLEQPDRFLRVVRPFLVDTSVQ